MAIFEQVMIHSSMVTIAVHGRATRGIRTAFVRVWEMFRNYFYYSNVECWNSCEICLTEIKRIKSSWIFKEK